MIITLFSSAMFPRLRVWRRLQQHLRLRPNPRRQNRPAVLRVCRHRGTEHDCGSHFAVRRCVKADVKLGVYSSFVSSVVCRSVQPDVGPPPAGERLEEDGSGHPAGDEPAAHQAPVLRGRQLPRRQVKTPPLKQPLLQPRSGGGAGLSDCLFTCKYSWRSPFSDRCFLPWGFSASSRQEKYRCH